MKRRQSIKWMGAAVAVGLMLGPAVASSQAQQAGGGGGTAQMNTLAQTGQLSSKDYDFLVKAARIDMEEVQAGELAQKHGTSPAVRAFGEHMINDHREANTGLKEIAAQKGAMVPTQLSQKQESMIQNLEGLSGASFDRAFAQDMVKGHEQAVKEFEQAAKNVSDPDLRAWAQTALPLLQEHLRMARNMEAAVSKQQ